MLLLRKALQRMGRCCVLWAEYGRKRQVSQYTRLDIWRGGETSLRLSRPKQASTQEWDSRSKQLGSYREPHRAEDCYPLLGNSRAGNFIDKVVRTAGLTHGICHAVQMYVPCEHIRYDRRGKCVRVREREAKSQWNDNDWSGAGWPEEAVERRAPMERHRMYGNLQNYCGPTGTNENFMWVPPYRRLHSNLNGGVYWGHSATDSQERKIIAPGGTITPVLHGFRLT